MLSNDNAGDLLKRAELHEQAAGTTDDLPARKMHLAMAAEFRRKAGELSAVKVSAERSPRVELIAVAR